ncbi:MAG: hypothetical protein AAF366_00260 [Pseudomonadota bacterium]
MIVGTLIRGAIFALITFCTLTLIDALSAGEITLAIVRRAGVIALIGALVYSAIRFVIAWANE